MARAITRRALATVIPAVAPVIAASCAAPSLALASGAALSDTQAKAWLAAYIAAGGSFSMWDDKVWIYEPVRPRNPELDRLLTSVDGDMRLRIVAAARPLLHAAGGAI